MKAILCLAAGMAMGALMRSLYSASEAGVPWHLRGSFSMGPEQQLPAPSWPDGQAPVAELAPARRSAACLRCDSLPCACPPACACGPDGCAGKCAERGPIKCLGCGALLPWDSNTRAHVCPVRAIGKGGCGGRD